MELHARALLCVHNSLDHLIHGHPITVRTRNRHHTAIKKALHTSTHFIYQMTQSRHKCVCLPNTYASKNPIPSDRNLTEYRPFMSRIFWTCASASRRSVSEPFSLLVLVSSSLPLAFLERSFPQPLRTRLFSPFFFPRQT